MSTVIKIKAFDINPDQKNTKAEISEIELFDNYMKYNFKFSADERNELIKAYSGENEEDEEDDEESYSDPLLRKLMGKEEKLFTNVEQEELSYIDKSAIDSIYYTHFSIKKNIHRVTISYSDEMSVHFRTKYEAIKVLDILKEWRWS